MKQVKLIVCDIDNTLVEKRKPLTARTKRVIELLQKHGVYFGVASGRPVVHLKTLCEQWGIHCDVYIGLNGAEICDELTGEHHLYSEMKPEWIRQCFEIMKPFETWPNIIFGSTRYVCEGDPVLQAANAYVGNPTPPHIVSDLNEFWLTEHAPKIGFRVREEDMKVIEETVASMKLEGFSGIKTETTMYEFCPADASKGKLLALFCQNHQIPLELVWAFGDMTNDISMFHAAGHSVCMCNGSEDAKQHAKYITEKSVHEDGFADFVECYILPEVQK